MTDYITCDTFKRYIARGDIIKKQNITEEIPTKSMLVDSVNGDPLTVSVNKNELELIIDRVTSNDNWISCDFEGNLNDFSGLKFHANVNFFSKRGWIEY